VKYRVMARMFVEKRHHQEGPEYGTRKEAAEAAREWDGVRGAIAHVEEVPRPRHRGHREASNATD
jgi:hypothetical protein